MSEAPDLHDLQRALGGRVSHGGRRWSGPGPGHSRRDASLSVRITDQGRLLTHSFAGDSFEACAAHLGLEGPRTARHGRPRPRQAPERQALALAEATRNLAFCADLWAGRRPIGGSAAADYLMDRGLPGPFPDELAAHEDAPFGYDGARRGPAMLARVCDPHGRPTGLHLTALGPARPGKRLRLMYGTTAGAVRLFPPTADGVLAVAEGIETAIGFHELNAIPCWSALSAGGVAAFEPPPGIVRLVIAADGDDPGLTAARALTTRLKGRCEVETRAAPMGRDWNDMVLESFR